MDSLKPIVFVLLSILTLSRGLTDPGIYTIYLSVMIVNYYNLLYL